MSSLHQGPEIRRAVIAGTGSYIPARRVPNSELEKVVETNDEWIVQRTGIRERRVAAPEEASSDMAAAAARAALADAGIDAAQVDLILVATCTPDMVFPNTASAVQQKIGATRAAACLDLNAACSGFVYALEIGAKFVAAGSHQCVLVIGAEKMSCITDWQDRGTCILFGDGAGAAVLRPGFGRVGVLDSILESDGSLGDLLHVPAGGSRQPASAESVAARQHFIRMEGREVFKHAVTNMTRVVQQLLERNRLTSEDVQLVIPHQANERIISAVRDKLGMPPKKVFMNLERYGNTSAASVGMAIDEAARTGLLRRGDVLVLVAFGAGFTWGATLVVWDKD